MSDVQVFRRRISPEQKIRREQIIAEAIVLISKQGPAVSMDAVARAASVSRTTLYRYYTSREHLLAEVTLRLGQNLISHLIENPPTGNTVGQKVQGLCHRISTLAGDNELLLAACVNNLSSEDPAVLDSFSAIEDLVSQMFKGVLGHSAPNRWLKVETVIFRYLFGSFVLATTGKISYSDLAEDVTALCRSLLADVWLEPA